MGDLTVSIVQLWRAHGTWRLAALMRAPGRPTKMEREIA